MGVWSCSYATVEKKQNPCNRYIQDCCQLYYKLSVLSDLENLITIFTTEKRGKKHFWNHWFSELICFWIFLVSIDFATNFVFARKMFLKTVSIENQWWHAERYNIINVITIHSRTQQWANIDWLPEMNELDWEPFPTKISTSNHWFSMETVFKKYFFLRKKLVAKSMEIKKKQKKH